MDFLKPVVFAFATLLEIIDSSFLAVAIPALITENIVYSYFCKREASFVPTRALF
jgi:hypothetical protein